MAIDTISPEVPASHCGPGKPECVYPFAAYGTR
jgi:hypothetical protein